MQKTSSSNTDNSNNSTKRNPSVSEYDKKIRERLEKTLTEKSKPKALDKKEEMKEMRRKILEKRKEELGKMLKPNNVNNTTLDISIHEKTNRIVVKIIDKDTMETIREVPPEYILDILAGFWEIAGLLMDTEA